jgi:cytochrome b561
VIEHPPPPPKPPSDHWASLLATVFVLAGTVALVIVAWLIIMASIGRPL